MEPSAGILLPAAARVICAGARFHAVGQARGGHGLVGCTLAEALRARGRVPFAHRRWRLPELEGAEQGN
eukprot:11718543-Alexandrium_andersonii.AAC.1